jgi:hypothetical protein
LIEKEVSKTLSQTEYKLDGKGKIIFDSIQPEVFKKYKKLESKLNKVLNMFGFDKLEIVIDQLNMSEKQFETQEYEIAEYLNKKTKTAKTNKENN